jgi:hypothetical protein
VTLAQRHIDALAGLLGDGEVVVALHDHDGGGDVETSRRELRVTRWPGAAACEVLVVRDLAESAHTALALLRDGSVVGLEAPADLAGLLWRLRDTLTAAEAAALLASFAPERGHTLVADAAHWRRLARGAEPPAGFVALDDGPLRDRPAFEFCTAVRPSPDPLAPPQLWRWRLDLGAEPVAWTARPLRSS